MRCSSFWQGILFIVLQFLPVLCVGWIFFFLQGAALHLEFLANYICELSLLEYSLLCYLPSLVAASSVFLAKFILIPIKNPWVCVDKLIFFMAIKKTLMPASANICFMFDQKQNSSLSYYTRYTPSELRGCVRVLHQLLRFGPGTNLPAIREKYSQHKVRHSYIRWLLMRIIYFVTYSNAECRTLYLRIVQICSKEVLPTVDPC